MKACERKVMKLPGSLSISQRSLSSGALQVLADV